MHWLTARAKDQLPWSRPPTSIILAGTIPCHAPRAPPRPCITTPRARAYSPARAPPARRARAAQINEATKQNFLKRIHYPSLSPAQFYLGARFTVLSRCLQIVAFSDEGTRKWCERSRSRAVGLIALPSAAALPLLYLDCIWTGPSERPTRPEETPVRKLRD